MAKPGAQETSKTGERKAVRVEMTTAAGSKTLRNHEECMLIENYFIIFTIKLSFDQDRGEPANDDRAFKITFKTPSG